MGLRLVVVEMFNAGREESYMPGEVIDPKKFAKDNALIQNALEDRVANGWIALLDDAGAAAVVEEVQAHVAAVTAAAPQPPEPDVPADTSGQE